MAKFHPRTLELFGPPGFSLDPERGTWVSQLAARSGVRLPAAVAEWYCVPEASTLWKWFKASDYPAIGFHPGERQPWMESAQSEGDSLIEDRHSQGWWFVPRPREDVRGWIRSPILPVVYETQGCCWWGVPLDGSDDPPVVVCEGDQGDHWDHFAGSFSDFVLARVFDLASYYSGETRRMVEVDADVSADQLRALRARFQPGPTTRDGDRLFTHRFLADGQRFSLMVMRRDNRSTGYSLWQLWAADPDRFRTLVATLSETYGRLQGVTPDSKSTLYLRGEQTAAEYQQHREQFPF